MTPRQSKTLALFLMALLLTACTFGGKAVPLSVIEPQLDPVNVDGLMAVDWSIEVPRPITDQMRDSDRVIVRRDSTRLQVYPGISWLDSAPEMFQTLLVQAFADSEKFAGVGRTGLRARYALVTELRRFELVDDNEGLRVELTVSSNLIHQRSIKSIAARTFQASISVNGSGLQSTITAFETALSDVLNDLTQWTLQAGSEFSEG